MVPHRHPNISDVSLCHDFLDDKLEANTEDWRRVGSTVSEQSIDDLGQGAMTGDREH